MQRLQGGDDEHDPSTVVVLDGGPATELEAHGRDRGDYDPGPAAIADFHGPRIDALKAHRAAV